MISISKIIMQILVVRPKLFYPKYILYLIVFMMSDFLYIKTVNLCNYNCLNSKYIKLIPKTDLLFLDRENFNDARSLNRFKLKCSIIYLLNLDKTF
jgi:hypothetical protein